MSTKRNSSASAGAVRIIIHTGQTLQQLPEWKRAYVVACMPSLEAATKPSSVAHSGQQQRAAEKRGVP